MQLGEPVKINETFVSPDVFDLLPEEDKQIINELKHKALGLCLAKTLS